MNLASFPNHCANFQSSKFIFFQEALSEISLPFSPVGDGFDIYNYRRNIGKLYLAITFEQNVLEV